MARGILKRQCPLSGTSTFHGEAVSVLHVEKAHLLVLRGLRLWIAMVLCLERMSIQSVGGVFCNSSIFFQCK